MEPFFVPLRGGYAPTASGGGTPIWFCFAKRVLRTPTTSWRHPLHCLRQRKMRSILLYANRASLRSRSSIAPD